MARLRIFEDDEGRFDRSLLDVGGEVLVVSQFTLLGDASKGSRPSFSNAAAPAEAELLYEALCEALRELDVRVETGRFGARMAVELINDGPVTIVLEIYILIQRRRPWGGADADNPHATARREGSRERLERLEPATGQGISRALRWST